MAPFIKYTYGSIFKGPLNTTAARLWTNRQDKSDQREKDLAILIVKAPHMKWPSQKSNEWNPLAKSSLPAHRASSLF